LAEPRRVVLVQAAPSGASVRAAAALAIQAVLDQGRSLTDALEALPLLDDERDRPLVHEIGYGVLRTLPRQEALAKLLLHKPLKREDADLRALILVGLYQLTDTRIPAHAAVAATVEAARAMGKGWAASLINALLRRFQREREPLLARVGRSPEVRSLFPHWLLQRLRAAWPEHWREIVAASNARAPMCLRVSRTRTTRAEYAQRLSTAGLTARPTRYTADGLTLDRPVPTARLPGFSEGLVSVQDAGAQLAAELLGARPGERVLDACAAPGGKSAHILERAGEERLDLTALDSDPQRLERVRDNLSRLGLAARVVHGDAAAPAGDWANVAYDRILLDAPCSATGVIRRHPDIKWLRRDSDIGSLADLQARMLDALWPLLVPGGTLLYVTCSLLPEENEGQVGAFVRRHDDAREALLDATWGVARALGRQTLPSEGEADGFYYVSLKKVGP
jgi:16S rRNA (cytosine967-C5)-methyltransferase